MFFVGGVGFYDSGVGVFEVFWGVYVYEFVEFVVVVVKYFFDFVGAVIDGVENLAVYQRLIQLWKIYYVKNKLN